MNKMILLGLVLLSGFTIAFVGKARSSPLPSMSTNAHCVVNVPREWGEYVSADRYGVSFKDESGTLRFVTQLPCGLDVTPHVALEIRRK